MEPTTPPSADDRPRSIHRVNRDVRHPPNGAPIPSDGDDDPPGVVAPDRTAAHRIGGRPTCDPHIKLLDAVIVAAFGEDVRSVAESIAAEDQIDQGSIETLLQAVDLATDCLYLPDERAALAYAAVAATGERVPEALIAELRRHFSARDIFAIGVAVAAELQAHRTSA